MSASDHSTGVAYLPNLATGATSAYEPEINAGSAIELGASNELPLPIPPTLAVQQYGPELAIDWQTEPWSNRDNLLLTQNGTTVHYLAGDYPTFTTPLLQIYNAAYSVEENKTYRVIMEFSTNTFTQMNTRNRVYNATEIENYTITMIEPAGSLDITGTTRVEYEFTSGLAGIVRLYISDTGTLATGEILEMTNFSFMEKLPLGFNPAPLPEIAIDVSDQAQLTDINASLVALIGDGVANDTSALNTIATFTAVTNWYFPTGKTFNLNSVDVPSHIEAVYGEALIKSIYVPAGDNLPRGAFWINSTINGLIFDGLSFERTSDYDHTLNGSYGHITFNTFSAKNNMENIEVRNCNFDGEFAPEANDVKVAGADIIDNAYFKNAYFHSNTHTNNGLFAYEITNKKDINFPDNSTIDNVHIFNNNITGAGGYGISMVGLRSPSHVYNNNIDGTAWGVENNSCNFLEIRNNRIIATVQAITSTLSSTNQVYDYGSCEIYDNHFESPDFLFHTSSDDNVYHNFINAEIWMQRRLSNINQGFNLYENTIVRSGGSNIKFEDMDSGEVHNNDIYNTGAGTSNLVNSDTASSVIEVRDNNFYSTNGTNVSIDPLLTNPANTGNISTLNYVGPIPTSRDGAGLVNSFLTLVNGDGTVTQVDNTYSGLMTYTLTNQTALEAITHTVTFTTADLALIEADTSLMGRLSKGATDTGLSLVTADVFGHYAFMEKEGAYCVDDKAGYGVEKVVNGTFDIDLTGFEVLTGTAEVINEKCYVDGSTSVYIRNTILWDLALSVNIMSFEIGLGDFSTFDIYNETAGAYVVPLRSITEDDIYSVLFVPSLPSDIFRFYFRSLIDLPHQGWIDNISVREATASEITNYLDTVRQNVDFNPLGTQDVQFVRDAVGVPTAVADVNTLMMYEDTSIDTGLKPNLTVQTLVEDVSGSFEDLDAAGIGLGTFSQRQEERVLTTEPKYYINKVLQGYVPIPPVTTVTMNLNATAIIGHADTVTQRHGRLKMKPVELTQAEIDAL